MERIEERFSSNTQRHQVETRDPQRNQTDSRNPPMDTSRSTNPHFTTLWKTIFAEIQLRHHSNSWNQIPPSVNKNLRELAKQITPPRPSDQTSKAILDIMMEAGLRIRSTIQEHIAEQILHNRQVLENIDTTDYDKALAIAGKHLQSRLGRKIHANQLQTWMEETGRNISRIHTRAPPPPTIVPTTTARQPYYPPSDQLGRNRADLRDPPGTRSSPPIAPTTAPQTARDHTLPTPTTHDWTQIPHRTNKRQQPDSRTPPTFVARSRFEPITPNDTEPNATYDEEEATEESSPIFVTKPRPNPTTQNDARSNHTEEEELTKGANTQAPIPNHPPNNNNWRHRDTETEEVSSAPSNDPPQVPKTGETGPGQYNLKNWPPLK